ncbi:MAG TPA: hypothetical protein DEA08_11680, partial [Planctomycetes bacterium]|nr:hypothetical protein [Planctomycetota bacterium]
MLQLLEPLRVIPGPLFLIGYLVCMFLLPLLMGRRPAGLALLVVGGAKAFLGLSHGHSVGYLGLLLVITLFTHVLSDGEGGGGYSGGSCSGGGFFFFGG